MANQPGHKYSAVVNENGGELGEDAGEGLDGDLVAGRVGDDLIEEVEQLANNPRIH